MSYLEEYRKKSGISIDEVVYQLGLNKNWYLDLEAYTDEIFSTISIAHLQLLGKILNTEPLKLLFGETYLIPEKQVSFFELSDSLNEKMKEMQMNEKEFSEFIGWELKDVLIDPQELWNMNVNGLIDICKVTKINWDSVLPRLPDSSIEKACL